jgi:signal transduction histidine kinase
MLEFLKGLFRSDFVPHGYCMRWDSDVVWLHVVSDFATALAYYMIPIALVYFVRRRQDLAFNWMFVAFGIFILACGTTHVLAVYTLWKPIYRFDGVVKAITAAASVATAVALLRIMPQAIALPSPAQLRAEVQQRKAAEDELRVLNTELENRVQQRTEALERHNLALQRVAYISSHDLREPLRTIATASELVKRRYAEQLTDDGRELLGLAIAGARRADQLIADLLEYSRVVGDSSEVQTERVDPGEVLRDAMADLDLKLKESGAEVTIPGPLPPVRANPRAIRQVFFNLLSNAIKYRHPERSLAITITGERRGQDCLFTVRDNGIGFRMTYAEQIFQAFRRLHGPEVEGSGIGLSLCRNIVEAHGGRIWTEASENEGAAFFFTLRAAEPNAA